MKIKLLFLGAALCFAGGAAAAQSAVSLEIDTSAPGPQVPADFSGLSIFTGTQVSGHRDRPGCLFSGTNSQLLAIFKNAGLHHLRHDYRAGDIRRSSQTLRRSKMP